LSFQKFSDIALGESPPGSLLPGADLVIRQVAGRDVISQRPAIRLQSFGKSFDIDPRLANECGLNRIR
jgi:hypothetical protein